MHKPGGPAPPVRCPRPSECPDQLWRVLAAKKRGRPPKRRRSSSEADSGAGDAAHAEPEASSAESGSEGDDSGVIPYADTSDG